MSVKFCIAIILPSAIVNCMPFCSIYQNYSNIFPWYLNSWLDFLTVEPKDNELLKLGEVDCCPGEGVIFVDMSSNSRLGEDRKRADIIRRRH